MSGSTDNLNGFYLMETMMARYVLKLTFSVIISVFSISIGDACASNWNFSELEAINCSTEWIEEWHV